MLVLYIYIFAGNCGLRTNDSCDGMGRTDERTFICIRFQSSNAFDCGIRRFYAVG